MTIDNVRERFRMLLASAGQQESASAALARRINRCLLVFDDQLYDLASGNFQPITDVRDANAIAQAAARLLASADTDSECIILLLPPAEFLADQVDMPGLSAEAMRAALGLRAMTQLPEYDQALDLALTCHSDSTRASSALAWWMSAARSNALFEAFSAHSLFVAALLPRNAWLLAALQRSTHAAALAIEDKDQRWLTITASHPAGAGAAFTGMQSVIDDLADPLLFAQWQTQRQQAGIDHIDHSIHSGEDFLGLVRRHQLAPFDTSTTATAVFPAAALAARHQLNKGQRRHLLLRASAAVIALVLLPFIYQSWQLMRLQSQLVDIRAQAAEARQHQALVRDFENQWGVMTEFPHQDIGATMLELQSVINPGVLTLFEIDEGLISIEGESQDPQNLLEQLEQNPLFTEVDFARATNNNRYFIDLRLSTVNFPAYQQWHFPESR